MMSFVVDRPGMLTTIQDMGRWGHQRRGVPVSGPMDAYSLRVGNAMLGNDPNDAALELTFFGLQITIQRTTCIALAGADPHMTINGSAAAAWTVYRVNAGDRIAMPSMPSEGSRSYLCFSGGIDVPLVMGSRATYTRASIGGFRGRALAAGDRIPLFEPRPLWERSDGFSCPKRLRPIAPPDEPIYAVDGPQVDAFTEKGLRTFYGEEYVITNDFDRMGCRFDGPEIERQSPADIVSDAIQYGAVQVPGRGTPIAMLADRQTTGGYTKIAVLTSWSTSRLAQKRPGQKVRFARVNGDAARDAAAYRESLLWELDALRASFRSRRIF